MTAKKTTGAYWIKRRSNPQTGVYFVAMGQLAKKVAKSHEETLYGNNEMLEYATEAEYTTALATLRDAGHRVR